MKDKKRDAIEKRKAKKEAQEKKMTCIALIVAIVTVIVAAGIVIFAVVRSENAQNNVKNEYAYDAERARGIWLSEDRLLRWSFEGDEIKSEVRASAENEFILESYRQYVFDEKKGKLAVASTENTRIDLPYRLEGDILTVQIDGKWTVFHRVT